MPQPETTMIGISAVIPMYEVARYLPDLLRSLSAQRPGRYRLEVIFVDDGSPDSSGELAEEWLASSAQTGRVIRRANGGVSAARNTGLAAATEAWVTFPDSDDVLDPDYFRAAAEFLAREGARISLGSANLLRLREPDPVPRNVHALSFRFAAGDRVVPIDRYPDFFQLNVASAFFHRRDLVASGIRFRTGLHASEDALFVAEYLLRADRPRVGLIASAKYVYRRRAAGDSAVDRYRQEPDTYIERFRDGYLPLLQGAADRGPVPGWLQSMFLYECQWLLPIQLTEDGYAHVLDEDGRRHVREALGACTRLVDEKRLWSYDATALPLESRLVLQALAGRPLPRWLGAYVAPVGSATEVLTFATAGDDVVVRQAGAAVAVAEETPDYFGQQVLRRVRARVPGVAGLEVSVGSQRRRIARRSRGDSEAEQLDRARRRAVRGTPLAVPARAGEVRVWKPIVGPGGSLRSRLGRVVRILRMRRERRASPAG